MEQYFASTDEFKINVERVQQEASEFRDIVTEAIQNPILRRAIEGLNVLSAAARMNLKYRAGSWKPLVESHKQIVAALETRDSSLAQQAITNHMQTLASLFSNDASGKDEKNG